MAVSAILILPSNTHQRHNGQMHSVAVVWDVATGKALTTIDTGYSHSSSYVWDSHFFLTPDWQTLFVPEAGKPNVGTVEQGGKRQRCWQFEGNVRAFGPHPGPSRHPD